jgi:hypothetical protein
MSHIKLLREHPELNAVAGAMWDAGLNADQVSSILPVVTKLLAPTKPVATAPAPAPVASKPAPKNRIVPWPGQVAACRASGPTKAHV